MNVNLNFGINFKCKEMSAGEFTKKYSKEKANNKSYIVKELVNKLSIATILKPGMLSSCSDDYSQLKKINKNIPLLIIDNKNFNETVTIEGI